MTKMTTPALVTLPMNNIYTSELNSWLFTLCLMSFVIVQPDNYFIGIINPNTIHYYRFNKNNHSYILN